MALNPKQALFVAEYLVDLNATQAAIRAGYSPKTAEQQGCRLLRNAQVAAAVEAGKAERAEKTGITAERVLAELAKLAFADPADVVNWGTKEVAFGYDADGKKLAAEDIGDAAVVQYVQAPFVDPINRDDLPEDVRAAVSEVGLTKDGFKIKMHDKKGALELLGRHLGLFPNKMEHTIPPGGLPPATLEIVFVDAKEAKR